MLNNDIDSVVGSRIAVVFEGVLGVPMFKRHTMYLMARQGKWEGLAASFELQPTTMASINQLAHRDSLPIDIYTFKYGADFAEALALRFMAIQLAVSNVWYVSEEDAKNMAEVAGGTTKYIYDSDQKRLESYGFRGFGVKPGGAIQY